MMYCRSKFLVFALVLGMPLAWVWRSMSPALAQASETNQSMNQNAKLKAEADRLRQITNQLIDNEQYQEAIVPLNQVLEIYRKLGNQRQEGTTLRTFGEVYNNLSKYDKALEYYQQALLIAEKLGNREEEGTVLNNIGMVYQSIGHYEKALEYLQRSLIPTRAVKDRTGESITLINLGNTYRTLGNYSQALEHYQNAIVIYQESGQSEAEANVLLAMAEMYQVQSPKATEYYERAFAIYRKLGQPEKEAETLQKMAGRYWREKQFPQMMEYYERALAIYRKSGQLEKEAETLQEIAWQYWREKQFPKATEYYERAFAIYRKLGQLEKEAETLEIIAWRYWWNKEQFLKAMEYYQRALTIYQKLDQRDKEAHLLETFASLELEQSRYPRALEHYQQALTLYQSLGQSEKEVETLQAIASIYSKLGDYSKALGYYQGAISGYRRLGKPEGEAGVLEMIASMHWQAKQYAKAAEYYDRVLTMKQILNQPEDDDIVDVRIDLYDRIVEDFRALEYYQGRVATYQKLRQPAKAAKLLQAIAQQYVKGKDYEKALEYYHQAIVIYQSLKQIDKEADALQRIAWIYQKIRDYVKAFEYYHQAIIIYHKLGNLKWELNLLQKIADLHRTVGEEAKAREYDQQVIEMQKQALITQRKRDRQEMGQNYVDISTINDISDLYKDPEKLDKLLRFDQDQGKQDEEAFALSNLSETYEKLGQYDQALAYAQQAYILALLAGDEDKNGFYIYRIENLYSKQGNYQEILGFYQNVLLLNQSQLEISRKLIRNNFLEDLLNKNQLKVYGKLIRGYLFLGQYEKARAVYHQLRKAYSMESIKDKIYALEASGDSFFAEGQYRESLKIYTELLDLFENAKLLYKIGDIYYLQRDYENASLFWRDAWDFYQKSLPNNRISYSEFSNLVFKLGDFYFVSNKYRDSVNYYENILNSIDKYGGIWRKQLWSHRLLFSIQIFKKLTKVYLVQGQYVRAVELWELKFLPLTRKFLKAYGPVSSKLYDSLKAESLKNIGKIYFEKGDYSQAVKVLQKSLVLSKNNSGDLSDVDPLAKIPYVQQIDILESLGILYLRQGQLDKAANFYQQALSVLRDKEEEINASELFNLSYDSLSLEQKLVNTLRDSGWRLYLELSQKLASIRLRNQEFSMAEKILLEAREIFIKRVDDFQDQYIFQVITTGSVEKGLVSEREKIQYFGDFQTLFQLLQKALIAQNKIESALEISEQVRARVLIEMMGLRSPLTPKNSSSPGQSPLGNYPLIAEMQTIAKAQKATLVSYSLLPDDSTSEEFLYPWNPLSDVFAIAQARQAVPSRFLYIWVVRPDGTIHFRQLNLNTLKVPLTQLVQQGRDAIGARGRAGLVAVALNSAAQDGHSEAQLQQLHQILIEPIASLLPTDPAQRVVFIPQGELFLVPFPALKDGSGQYLVEKHTILTAPAIQVLQLTRQSKEAIRQREAELSQKQPALVVGDPVMPKLREGQLTALPGAEAEARTIAKQLNVTPLLGQQATETEVVKRMTQAPIIHLATHGLLETRPGDVPGAIALAPSGENDDQDGFLTSREIFGLKLQADLVVLSACDTARGDITGDGVVGLSRTLMLAGAPSVIVSLWKVPDRPTASLMTEFYRNWQERKLDKAQALREAMLSTMRQYPNPRDWAAFTLIGEAE